MFEKQIDEIIAKLTLEEKVAMCHANALFSSAGVERLGIDDLIMSDGPHGVRREFDKYNWRPLNSPDDKCTYLPTESCLAATWNKELTFLFGETLGSEARYRGKDIILGPGVNIMRNPLCGRNFEYLSEDPCLTAELGAEIVKGIQTQDVACCVKHYALNNQELDRSKVNVEVDKTALFEIYLKAFEKIVKIAKPYSMMGAYNKFLNQHCCHNKYLVKDILKGKWGFDGVFVSDWAGTHDTDEAIENGLDIEMGSPRPYDERNYLGKAFLDRAKDSEKVQKLLDDKARRILRLMFRINKFSADRKNGEYNTAEHQNNAYKIASEAITLLKNDNVLPVSNTLKSILVFGTNATVKHAPGGNSSGVIPYYEVSILEGIKSRFKDSQIEYIPTTERLYTDIPTEQLSGFNQETGCRAYNYTSYSGFGFDGERTEGFAERLSISGVKAGSIKYYSDIVIEESGDYEYQIVTDCKFVLKIDGKELISAEAVRKPQTYKYSYSQTQGQIIHFELDIVVKNFGSFDLKWSANDRSQAVLEELLGKAKHADLVIACGGLNHNYESEAWDRLNLKLPEEDNKVIPLLAEVNKNTVAIITAGAPVEIPWADRVGAVLWGWFYGMEGGNALADIICGKINPSGKLPFTVAKKQSDYPCFRYGEYKSEICRYNEGLLVGYRGFDKDNIEPTFCFGHGLSYSSFEYSNLNYKIDNDAVIVSCEVTNTSSVDGKETVQVYVGALNNGDRPVRELKGFTKLLVRAKSTEIATIYLNKSDFEYFNPSTENFELQESKFIIEIGSSSRDIRLSEEIAL